MFLTSFSLLKREFLIFFVQLSEVKIFLTMLGSEIDNISMLLQEFNLNNAKRNSEDEILEPYFEEELDNSFGQFTFRFIAVFKNM